MIKKYFKKISSTSVIAVILLMSFLFVCKGVGINNIFDTNMDHTAMPCCDYDAGESIFGNVMDKFIAILPGLLSISIVLFVYRVYIRKSYVVRMHTYMYWYNFWVHRSVGSDLLFNFYNTILRVGILQPKLF